MRHRRCRSAPAARSDPELIGELRRHPAAQRVADHRDRVDAEHPRAGRGWRWRSRPPSSLLGACPTGRARAGRERSRGGRGPGGITSASPPTCRRCGSAAAREPSPTIRKARRWPWTVRWRCDVSTTAAPVVRRTVGLGSRCRVMASPARASRPGPSRTVRSDPGSQRLGVVNIMSTASNDRSTRWDTTRGPRVGTLGRVPDDDPTVSHHDGDDVTWTMRFRAPHRALADVVDGTYCGYVEDATVPFRRREAATGRVALDHQPRRAARPGGDDALVLRRLPGVLVRGRPARGVRHHRAPGRPARHPGRPHPDRRGPPARRAGTRWPTSASRSTSSWDAWPTSSSSGWPRPTTGASGSRSSTGCCSTG